MNWVKRPTADACLAKLRRSPGFAASDEAAIAALPADIRTMDANASVIPEGVRGDRIHVLLDGWAARFRILENGSRQIPALFVPGDACDIDALHLFRNDCGVLAITRCTVAAFGRDALLSLMDAHRGLRDAMYRALAIDNAVATQWTVCLGRRSARERLAHLLSELHARLGAAGAAGDDGYGLPLTQEELADVLGLTAVHVNRTLQGLRSDGLIHLRDQRLGIPDLAALRRVGGFDPAYLHLGDAGEAPRGASLVREDARAFVHA